MDIKESSGIMAKKHGGSNLGCQKIFLSKKFHPEMQNLKQTHILRKFRSKN